MKKLSVCVSVHNTGALLPRCLDSLIKQTYDDIEIILVNNGSTDNSLSIMQEYQKKCSNIRIFEQQDLGLARGRQRGVDEATGEYIAFLDADDYVLADMYRKLMKIAEAYSVDIVECETSRDGKLLSSPYEGMCDCQDILRDYFSGKYILSMLWLRIYRKSLFSPAVFPDIYINNEDIFALPCLLSKAKSIYFLKEPLHVYSTDNENAEMSKILFKKYSDEEIYGIKKKALGVVAFVESYIGKEYLECHFRKEFDAYKSRNITYFCVAKCRKIKPHRIVDELCANFNMNEEELNVFYRNSVLYPVFFEKIAIRLGVRRAIPIYRMVKKLVGGE